MKLREMLTKTEILVEIGMLHETPYFNKRPSN